MGQKSSWASVVENVRRALSPRGRAQLGQFVIEGLRLVERSVRAGSPPRQLLISDRQLRQQDERISALLAQIDPAKTELVSVPEGVILELAEGRNGGTLFGLCDIPKGPTLGELISSSVEGGGPLLVLVDVEEPGNVGALARTALASGAAGLVTVGVSDAFHPKALRTSMGSVFKLPIVRASKKLELLQQLAPLTRVGTVSMGGVAPWATKLPRALAVLVGSEAQGLSPEVLELVELKLTIPMPAGVDSYSVNAAAAVLMYEVSRQAATVR